MNRFLKLLMFLPLFYILGEWLEGPPTRVLVRSEIFMATMILLSVDSTIYLVGKWQKYKAFIIILNTLITISFVVTLRYRYDGSIVHSTDMIFFILLFLVFLQCCTWLMSLRKFPKELLH